MADKEYIERLAAMLAITNTGCTAANVEELMKVPVADVVEVVRCKDCIWFDPRYLDEDGTFWCEHTGFGRVTRYDYCSCGERKDDEA